MLTVKHSNNLNFGLGDWLSKSWLIKPENSINITVQPSASN